MSQSHSPDSWSHTVDKLDAMVIRAEFEHVEQILNDIKVHEVPNSLRHRLAGIYRRVGRSLDAMGLLAPLFRDTLHSPSESEILEYCHNLVALDLNDEAFLNLQGLDAKTHPEILLLKTSCWFREWDYASALPELQRYIELESLSGYQRHVGITNLIAALIFIGDFQEANTQLEGLIDRAQREDWHRLFINAMELKGQIASENGDWDEVSHWVEKQRDYIQKAPEGLEFLFSRNLECLVLAHKERTSQPLEEFRSLALSAENFEQVRYCDYQIAKFRNDKGLWNRVYHGTPFPSFRKKLRDECDAIESEYIISSKQDEIATLNLSSGTIGDVEYLKVGQSLHRLMIALCDDFYRPSTLNSLFSKVYPTDVYDWENSANRMHQLFSRLRTLFEDIPVELETESNHTYYLNQTGLAIRKQDQTFNNPVDLRFQQVLQHFGKQEFSAQDVAKVWNMSPRHAVKILNQQVEKKRLLKLGRGRATRYLAEGPTRPL